MEALAKCRPTDDGIDVLELRGALRRREALPVTEPHDMRER